MVLESVGKFFDRSFWAYVYLGRYTADMIPLLASRAPRFSAIRGRLVIFFFVARSCNRVLPKRTCYRTRPRPSGDTRRAVDGTPLQLLDNDCVSFLNMFSTSARLFNHPPTIANRAALSEEDLFKGCRAYIISRAAVSCWIYIRCAN